MKSEHLSKVNIFPGPQGIHFLKVYCITKIFWWPYQSTSRVYASEEVILSNWLTNRWINLNLFLRLLVLHRLRKKYRLNDNKSNISFDQQPATGTNVLGLYYSWLTDLKLVVTNLTSFIMRRNDDISTSSIKYSVILWTNNMIIW